MRMKRFLIEQNGVYYLTQGKLLEYDEKSIDDPDPDRRRRKREGVEEVKAEFRRIHDSPGTWYKCVEVKNSSFGPMNTGPSS